MTDAVVSGLRLGLRSILGPSAAGVAGRIPGSIFAPRAASLHFAEEDEKARHLQNERPSARSGARSEHLGEITKQMGSCGPEVTLDLEEVTVVDVHVVRSAWGMGK